MKIADYQAFEQPGYDRAAFMTTRQAAARIGVSHRTVQMWVENGALKAWKTAGGHRRITVASVEGVLETRRSALSGTLRGGRVPVLQSMAPTPCSVRRAAPRTVLVVEDDANLLLLYELEISTWDMGIVVHRACNGIEALARVGQARPDLLLSDLQMPGLDGFGLIRALRADPGTASLPLVVVSALDKPTVLSMGLPHDVPYFTKPAPLAVLRTAVLSSLPRAA